MLDYPDVTSLILRAVLEKSIIYVGHFELFSHYLNIYNIGWHVVTNIFPL